MQRWIRGHTTTSAVTRGLIVTFALTAVLYVFKAISMPLRSGPERHRDQTKGLTGVIKKLDEAQLRERFMELAPEFRLTHAGAGRPQKASNAEVEALMSLGLVERVKRPHVAAGVLEIYKLTPLGTIAEQRLAGPSSRQRRPLPKPIRESSG